MTDRSKLMKVLEEILEEDEVRMCRILLSETKMKLRFGKHEEEIIETNIGSPQGDAISGMFFNIAFERAMRDLRSILNEQNPKIEHNYCQRSKMPEEMIYADDTDFVNKDKEKDMLVRNKADEILQRHSLKVNNDNWEMTMVERFNNVNEEKWRETKKLGSFLGDHHDMKHRIKQSNQAMERINCIWPSKKLKVEDRLKIYKSIIKSILTYNYATWGSTKEQTEKLNRAHRNQLRNILSNPYMKNKKLYELTKETPISQQMCQARWRLLGHVMRINKDAPCQRAMDYYF